MPRRATRIRHPRVVNCGAAPPRHVMAPRIARHKILSEIAPFDCELCQLQRDLRFAGCRHWHDDVDVDFFDCDFVRGAAKLGD
jgi:hypothetical protein